MNCDGLVLEKSSQLQAMNCDVLVLENKDLVQMHYEL